MLQEPRIARHFSEMPITWSPQLRKGHPTIRNLLLFLLLFIAAFVSSSLIDFSKFLVTTSANKAPIFLQKNQIPPPKKTQFSLTCVAENQTQTCPRNYPTTFILTDQDRVKEEPASNSACPSYFRWIQEDLRPWKLTGITRDMVERANRTAHFRLVIVEGRAYVEKYKKSIQTRDLFTIWGILQLLRRYPGKLPDLELMFDCDDRPVVQSTDYRGGGGSPDADGGGPPPVFRYCSDRWSLDIVFPDWSFWGWAEINIKPWHNLLKELKEGNNRSKWTDREPYAYWKGNPFVADTRQDLLKCNVSNEQDWNARLFIQDWISESQKGFKHSDLANQCRNRYKIYIEGYAWSVSEKYILACDAVTLLVKPYFHDFFTRSLQPLKHYWPIKDKDKCKSIKFAVEWGNKHEDKAQAIGKAASDFMQQELRMEYVYDYMFHLLNEYASLLKFKPRVPEGASELCSEIMACPASGLERKFMLESLIREPSATSPCTMPPPFEPQALSAFYRKNLKTIRKVDKWENEYWSSLSEQNTVT